MSQRLGGQAVDASVLADWGNFYVIMGSAAAGLTGLTFVVIALAADSRRLRPAGLSAYMSPTVVHFSSVLALAAFMCIPHASLTGLAVLGGLTGMAGVLYGLSTIRNMRAALETYAPVGEDWLWHAGLPTLAYAALSIIAAVGARHSAALVYGFACVVLALLFIGIHNAWDVATAIALGKQPSPPAA
jgi:hypothetical protein